jgi:2-methylisocitrate lyase-like PEP mutase family enzyme
MTSQHDKARAFAALHSDPGTFIIPNPWDAGSARLLEIMGFAALATSSAGLAFSLGKADNQVGRDLVMQHIAELCRVTQLPVSADLENGFGDDPADAKLAIELAAKAGAVGGSIEDSTGRGDQPLYPIEAAAERIRAAVEAARAQPFPFTLTARAENYFVGVPDLKDTIKRLQAYQEAGADVLFAPGLKRREDIAAVLSSIDRPLNVLMGMADVTLTRADLAGMGVKRISVGGSLARAAWGGFLKAAEELRDEGTFDYARDAVPMARINGLFSGR